MPLTCWIVGEGTLPVRCGELLLAGGHSIAGVASPDPSLLTWAKERQIPTASSAAALAAAATGASFDYLFSIVNFWIIPNEVIAAARRGAINFHDGPLPKYAGSYATSWALYAGEARHGVTWHVMTDLVDGGDILKQRLIDVADRDTAVTLNAKCYEAAFGAFSDLLPELGAGSETRERQDLSARSFFGRNVRPASAAIVDWHRPAVEIANLVRALDFGQYQNPLGVPKLHLGVQTATFTAFRLVSRATASAGTIVRLEAGELVIATADSDVAIGGFHTLEGDAIDAATLLAANGLAPGALLPRLSNVEAAAISALNEAVSRHEPFWIQALGRTNPVSLPYAHAKPQQGLCRAVEFELPAALVNRLEGSFSGSSTTECLLAAFAIYLARVSGTDSFEIGYRSAVQPTGTSAQVFASFVPWSLAVDTTRTFTDVLQLVSDARATASRRQTFARDLVQRTPAIRGSKLEWSIVVDETSYGTSTLPRGAQVSLVIAQSGARLVYDSSALSDADAQRVRQHVVALLEGVAASPTAVLRAVPFIGEAEQKRLLVEWNQTERAYPDQPMHELFEAQAARTPDAVAAGCEGQTATYGDLNARANRLARTLRDRGVAPGLLVGVCAERSIEMLVGVLAILKAGGAYVPLDPAFPRDRLTFMAEDAGLRLVLTKGDVSGLLTEMTCTPVSLDNESAFASQPAGNLDPLARSEDLAYVLYTSGSTGKPKGVEVSHRALTNFLCAMQREPGCSASDIVLAITTLSFDIAGLELYLPLICGGRVQIASRRVAVDGRLLQEHIDAYGVTIVQATPATWRMLMATGWKGSPNVTALCGGEPLPADLVRDLTDRTRTLWNMYGPTETTIWSSVQQIRAQDVEVTIGKPIANTEFYVVDAALQLVPVGVPGELCIGGDGLARGYRQRPELTADRFVSHPFKSASGARLYRTGDLAKYRADGQVVHLGRLDHQVKLRGFRIELGEIETLLASYPGVRSAVVVARDTDRGADAYLAAYLVTAGVPPTIADLRGHLQGALPDYMIPSAFVFLDALPMTPNGKVDRKALPAPERDRARTGSAYVAPRTPIEESIAGIWKTALKLERVGVDDNFFELGGHSLSGLEISVRIEQTLGVHLPLQALFETPTPAGLAARVESQLLSGADDALLAEMLAEIEQVPGSSH